MITEVQYLPVSRRTVDESSDSLLASLDLAVRCRRQIQQAILRAENQLGALERVQSGLMAAKKATKKQAWTVSPEAKAAAAQVQPAISALAGLLKPELKSYEKQIQAIAKQLPVAAWALEQRGCGALMLGIVVGETGDLSKYDNPAKVWKRMGLAVMPDGKRQRRVAGDEGIYHGFSPRRRAIMYVLGDCLIKLNKGEFRALYDERKAFEMSRLDPKAKGVKGHAHARASRYMQKRFLRELWKAWNRTVVELTP